MSDDSIKLSGEVSNGELCTLHCPHCDGFYMHQTDIEIFNRVEDASEGTHVKVSGNLVLSDRDISQNPSRRKQGIVLSFECEGCSKPSSIAVYQHKGNTLIEHVSRS